MVDFNLEIKKAQPVNIKEMELNRYRIDTNIKKSIILYNMAIGEIKEGNLDLAINDLKKALSYNKGFSEAIKLMGLCYVNMKEYKKAEKVFKKLSKFEIYSILANEYIESLKIKKFAPRNIKTIDKADEVLNDKGSQYILNKALKGKIIIGTLITSIFIGGIIINNLYSINVQGVLKKFQANKEVTDYEKESGDENNKDLNKDEISPEKSTIAYEDYEKIQKNLEDTKSELDSYKNKYSILTMLNDTEESFKTGDYEKAASTLISIKGMNFDDETKVKFDKLWQDLTPNVLWTIYNQGNKLYKQNKYAEALPKLKIASEIDPNLNLMPWITYQIGTCYKETNDNTNALIYFKKVKDNYPKSEYASNAHMMIQQIEN